VKMGRICCPEMSVNNYHTMPCNIPEELRSHQHCGGSLKSRLELVMVSNLNGSHQKQDFESEEVS
jgi:hypothetical protein